ncbi:MAG: carboxypeptidase-like regulatory domain-containing protein [Gallionella sp.]|nr:carboxypeptidase-like regulatory domain-containing protein [Gallionella sp.]
MPPKPTITIRGYLLGAGLSLIVALLLLGLMLYQAETLVRLGLIGNLWYIVLLAMGLAVAVFLFLGLKSYASYTGEVLNGKLELGGPPVVMLVVVVLGFWLVPQPVARFDLTVFVHGEAGRQAMVLRNRGALLLDLGADRRRETIGDKGEVRFVGIPADQRGKTVTVTLDADGYELVEHIAQVKLSAESVYLAARAAPVHLSGLVQDANGKAVAGAQLRLASYTTQTLKDGWFNFDVPSDLPETERTLLITAPGFASWQGQVTPGSNQLSVVLNKE